jgi:serine/threonine protein kinase
MEEVVAESTQQQGNHVECWGVSADELRTLLAERFPERHCSVAEVSPDAPVDSVVASLRTEIETKNHLIDDLLLKTAASGASIHAFHSQQKQLFDEFCLLRQRYDDQKANLIDALWIKCGTYHPELKHIPALDEDLVANESDELIGKYSIGQHLGEGQFATVKLCWLTDTGNGDNGSSGDKEWALKIIKKERLTSFSSLRRVSNEINILQTLQSKFVVKLEGAIQSNTKLYIVTEKGGSDLFEFFDEHPEGVPEPWAKEITTCILQGILYCHQQGICHRGQFHSPFLSSHPTT